MTGEPGESYDVVRSKAPGWYLTAFVAFIMLTFILICSRGTERIADLLGLLGLLLAGSGCLYATMLPQFRTTFSAEGIQQKGLFRSLHLRWTDIELASQEGLVYRLTGPRNSLTLNTSFYSNRSQLDSLLRRHIPRSRWRV